MVKNKKIMKEIRSWILSVLVALCIVSVVNSKVFAKVQVQQSSMENTLYNNQQLIVDKFSYNFTSPERGDIIIFLRDEEKGNIIEDTMELVKSVGGNNDFAERTRLVKRVIGIPGDEVDIKDGKVYLNGEELNKTYIKGKTNEADGIKEMDVKFPIIVEEDKLFVLGDNREGSKDSRHFGLIDNNQVEGKVKFRVYPFDEMGTVE